MVAPIMAKEEAKEEVKRETKRKDKGFLKKLFRGGTKENAPRPIEELGQSITIHAVPEGVESSSCTSY